MEGWGWDADVREVWADWMSVRQTVQMAPRQPCSDPRAAAEVSRYHRHLPWRSSTGP